MKILAALLMLQEVSFPQQTDIYLDISQSQVQKPWAFIALHQNENVVNDYVAEKIMQHGGVFVVLRQNGQRHIQLSINEQFYKIDPNRIFTESGRRKSLIRLNPDLPTNSENYKEALARAESLSRFILESVKANQASAWIAIHNNTDGYEGDGKSGRGTISIKRYQKKLKEGANYLIKVHDANIDEDNLFFITDPDDYAAMVKAGWNVVLQNPDVAIDPKEDDGSLSVLAEMQEKRYINIEAEREDDGFGNNSIEEQKAMVDLTFTLLKNNN